MCCCYCCGVGRCIVKAIVLFTRQHPHCHFHSNGTMIANITGKENILVFIFLGKGIRCTRLVAQPFAKENGTASEEMDIYIVYTVPFENNRVTHPSRFGRQGALEVGGYLVTIGANHNILGMCGRARNGQDHPNDGEQELKRSG